MRSRRAAIVGSAAWFLVAPGSLVGLLPWAITGWRTSHDLGASSLTAIAGGLLIAAGILGLLESFGRFALEGLATPAPLTPTRQLIVTGFYRRVRNPMYVSVLTVIVGEALLLSQSELLGYAAAVWAIFHLFVVFYEEPAMRRRFPRDYAAYSRSVSRWLPRLRSWSGGA